MRSATLVLLAVALVGVQLFTPVRLGAQGAAPAPAGGAAPAPAAAAAPASPIPVFPATMKELMIDLIFPISNDLFYVSRNEQKDGVEWARLELNFLMLAESATLLMSPPRARDQGQWMKDAKLLHDVGLKAYRYAKAKDYEALVALNDELYESCQACHVNYRPGYRRRP